MQILVVNFVDSTPTDSQDQSPAITALNEVACLCAMVLSKIITARAQLQGIPSEEIFIIKQQVFNLFYDSVNTQYKNHISSSTT